MTHMKGELREFLEKQIKSYQKINDVEIHFGKYVSGEIFKTIYQDNNECEFVKR